MKKLVQTSTLAVLLLTLFSFRNIPELDVVGTYGVRGNDPAKIELRLNEDHTFSYQDLSNSAKPIGVMGNWEAKNNQILLKNHDSEFPFHSKWKIIKNGSVAKSRLGITFYTLVKE